MKLRRAITGLLVGLAVGLWASGLILASPAVASASEAGNTAEGGSHGADHGDHGSAGVNPLVFKSDLAIWTFVVFLVLLAVLWKYAWGPLSEALDRREQGIRGSSSRPNSPTSRPKSCWPNMNKSWPPPRMKCGP